MGKRKGFTLIELLTVIAILAVILLIALPIVISNVNKAKEKSYNNQMTAFVKGAERYALEYNNDIEWTEEGAYLVTYVTLKNLNEKGYMDLPVINPKTGEAFDPETTRVKVYKYSDGNYEFEIEGSDKLIVSPKEQTISQEYSYTKAMILTGITKVEDGISSSITETDGLEITCRYNGEVISCDTLSSTTKEIGKYTITYKWNSLTATRIVNVVKPLTPIIHIEPATAKTESVKVTIEYPNKSTSKKYKQSTTNKENNYNGNFTIYQNQIITATCIDSNGINCLEAKKVVGNIIVKKPIITTTYTPSNLVNGYLLKEVASVKFDVSKSINPKRFIKTKKSGVSNVVVTQSCGTGELPTTCTTIESTKNLSINTWYVVENDVNITYSDNTNEKSEIMAILYDGISYSDISVKELQKIDTTSPTVALSVKKKTSGTNVSHDTWSNELLNYTFTADKVGSSGYTIYYCADTNNSCSPTTNATSGTVIPLTNTGTYYVRYKIVGGTGVSSSIGSFKAKIDMTSPTVALSVKKKTSGTNVSHDTWSNELLNYTFTADKVGSSGYTIYYCADTNNSCSPATNATSGTAIPLTNTGTYYVRYKIVGGSGVSSSIGSFKAKIDTSRPTITLKSSSSTINSITIVATVTDTESGVKDVSCKTGSISGKVVSNGNNTYTCTISGLSPATKYDYTLIATDNSDMQNSLTDSKSTLVSITGTPVITASWENTDTKIKATVSGVSATGETVSYRYSLNGVVKQDWTTSNSYTFTGLTSATAYTIKVETKATTSGTLGNYKQASIYTAKYVSASGSYSYTSSSSCYSSTYYYSDSTGIYSSVSIPVDYCSSTTVPAKTCTASASANFLVDNCNLWTYSCSCGGVTGTCSQSSYTRHKNSDGTYWRTCYYSGTLTISSGYTNYYPYYKGLVLPKQTTY